MKKTKIKISMRKIRGKNQLFPWNEKYIYFYTLLSLTDWGEKRNFFFRKKSLFKGIKFGLYCLWLMSIERDFERKSLFLQIQNPKKCKNGSSFFSFCEMFGACIRIRNGRALLLRKLPSLWFLKKRGRRNTYLMPKSDTTIVCIRFGEKTLIFKYRERSSN